VFVLPTATNGAAMSDHQQFDNSGTAHGRQPSPRTSSDTASERAAGQINSLVERDRETEQLVSGLARPDEPREAGAPSEDSSRALLRAMTAPPHDAGHIDEMTNAAARVRPTAAARPRQPWWQGVLGWLPRRR
jgi:hypothetical protein